MTDPDVQPADPDGQLADPDVPPADLDVPPAISDGPHLQEQVARLDELDELPVAEHIDRYEAVHNELHAALRGIHDPGG